MVRIRWWDGATWAVSGLLPLDEAANAVFVIAELVGKPGADPDSVKAAVRGLVAAGGKDCTNDEILLRDDLLCACGLLQLGDEGEVGWDVAAAAAIQTIAEADKSIGILVSATDENQESIKRLLAENDEMRGHIAALRSTSIIGESQVAKLRAELYLAEQSRDEWESRAVQAESNVETLEAELRNRECAPAVPCASTTYLLDIALKALRGEGTDADQLATLIDAARRAA